MTENEGMLKRLSTEVVGKLREKGLYLSTMESCTGGGLANAITNISKASEMMKESFVTYSTEAKIKNGVSVQVIERYSVYSNETAVEMAKAARFSSVKADIGVGITGTISTMDTNNANSVPGEVYVAVNTKDKTTFKQIIFDKTKMSREEIKEGICIEAEKMILESI